MRRPLLVSALVVATGAAGAACASSFGEEPIASEPSLDAGGDVAAIPPADGGAGTDADADARALGSTVSGEVVFVDAGSAAVTTVILAPADFDTERFHESPPVGPRATDVSGAWTIRDVPAGTYLVLAGYERDGLVLDPTTPAPKVTVTGDAAETVTVSAPQKLVRALAVVTIQSKSSEPAITFVDGPGEDAYAVTVIDFQSKPIYGATEPLAASNANVKFQIDAGLVVPLRYRFRVTAKKDGASVTQTEDLAAIRTAAPDDT